MENTIFKSYDTSAVFYDEVFDHNGSIKDVYQNIYQLFNALDRKEFLQMVEEAKTSFFNQGITFAVYSDTEHGTEKIFPFDLFPRIISAREWDHIERGAIQRTLAVNEFLYDIYHDKKIIKDKIVPEHLLTSCKNYLPQMMGFEPPGKVYTHISGTDIIRHSDGQYYVLEDNLRSPSGVSYVVNNRLAMKRTLFGMFDKIRAHPVAEYPEQLLRMLQSVKPKGVDTPTCVVLTPGAYNSAYYEHVFLAQTMGVELVEGRDLFVENDFVYMKTIYGPVKVDVIYRRIDDDFIDPRTFRPDSLLGVPGLIASYKAGKVTLANAPGTGVSDDKAVYTYVPEIIRYYLKEEPILNNVRTYRCQDEQDMKYILENVDKLVVKPVDEAGGYGISIGNRLTKEEIRQVKDRIRANPRKYIAQPIMSLSVHATYIEDTQRFEPRHVDLRTYTLLGKEMTYVLKGGLTRVALRKGNLIVNSSQGGGSKDTWVLDEE
jgi:uncharacterized circularly permuted ATP-grasp superfamily protein